MVRATTAAGVVAPAHGIEIEEQGGELDARHAVDQGVVYPLDQPHAIAGQPGDEVQVPQWTIAGEHLALQVPGDPA